MRHKTACGAEEREKLLNGMADVIGKEKTYLPGIRTLFISYG
jgi:hypothetical protein